MTRVAATAVATIWVMAMATRLAGNKQRKGMGGKGKCEGDEGRVLGLYNILDGKVQ